MSRLVPRRASAVAIAAIVLSLGLSAPSASAAWQTSVSAPPFALSAATLGTPATSCTTVPGVLADSARISWAAVPEAKKYRVSFGSSNPVIQETTALSIDVTGTLLLSLLGSVLFGTSTTVTVSAVDEDWISSPSNAHTIVLSNVISGLLGGVKCQS